MKEIDDTEFEIEGTLEDTQRVVAANALYMVKHLGLLNERILVLEKEVTLLLEQRETARAPEGGEVDPEWYGGD